MSTAGAIKAGRAFVELFADDRKLVRGLKQARARMKRFGSDMRKVGKSLAMLGAAVAVPIVASVKAFSTFEKELANVSTMLGDDKYLKSYKTGLKSLAVQTGESTETLSKGLYDILSASVPAGRALEFLNVAAKAAKGGVTTTAVAVDGLTSVMNAFQIRSGEAARVSDLMFATVKSGKITFEELAANIGKVAPMAKAAGMSIDQMLAAISTMTRQGLSAEEATTRLVNVMKQFPAAAGNLPALIAQFKGMNLSEILKVVPNIRAASGLAALGNDAAGLSRDIALMGNSAGMAEVAFKKMDRTTSATFAKLKQSIVMAAVSIGDALAPTISKLAEGIQHTATVVSEWVQENQGAIISIAKITAGVIGAGIALYALGAAVGVVSGLITVLTTVIGIAHFAIIGLTTVITFLVTPVGLVTAAILGLLGTIVYFAVTSRNGQAALYDLGEAFTVLRDDAVAAFGGIVKALKAGDIGLAADILWGLLKVAWVMGTQALETAWSKFARSVVKENNNFWTTVLMGSVIAWHGIEKGAFHLFHFLEDLWSDIKAASKYGWDLIVDVITDIWTGAMNGLIDVFNATVGKITDTEIGKFGETEHRNKGVGKYKRVSDKEKKESEDFYKSLIGVQEKARDKALIGLAESAAAREKKEDAEAEGKLSESQKVELEKAREALAASIAIAEALPGLGFKKHERPDITTKELGVDTVPGLNLKGGDITMPDLPDIGNIMAEETAKVGARGLFVASNAALAGLGAGSAQDKIAVATKKTADNTKEMLALYNKTISVFGR